MRWKLVVAAVLVVTAGLFVAISLVLSLIVSAPDVEAFVRQTAAPSFETYTKVGQKVPAFEVTMLDAKTFSPAAYEGKVLVISLWATWCGPCKQEMPRLESELWKGSNPAEFMLIAIAREESDQQIAAFGKSNAYTFPMASDPDRKIFKLFASAGIPRTYVVDKDGTILYQSLGYNPEEFDELKVVVKTALSRKSG